MKGETNLKRWCLAGVALLGGLGILGLFAWSRFAPANEALNERRTRIEGLSPAEKVELLEQKKKFDKLDAAEQQRLRQLSAELNEAPNSAELRGVMQRYYSWLKTLPPYRPAELAELTPTKRIAEVKRLLDEQQKSANRSRFGELARYDGRKRGYMLRGKQDSTWLNPADVEVLLKWLEEYAARQGTRFFEKLPKEKQRELGLDKLAQEKDPLKKHEILATAWLWRQISHPDKKRVVSEQDLADLRAKFSPETRARLESKSADEQWAMITQIIPRYLLRQEAAQSGVSGRQLVGEDELAEFFENHLTAEQRSWLLNLPNDALQRELWRMYMGWKFFQGRPSRSGPGFGPVPSTTPGPEAGPGLRETPPETAKPPRRAEKKSAPRPTEKTEAKKSSANSKPAGPGATQEASERPTK